MDLGEEIGYKPCINGYNIYLDVSILERDNEWIVKFDQYLNIIRICQIKILGSCLILLDMRIIFI